MIGMHVSFERVEQLDAQLVDQCGVAPDLLEHRVDNDASAAAAIGEQIGVGRRWWIEQLTKNQHLETSQDALQSMRARCLREAADKRPFAARTRRGDALSVPLSARILPLVRGAYRIFWSRVIP